MRNLVFCILFFPFILFAQPKDTNYVMRLHKELMPYFDEGRYSEILVKAKEGMAISKAIGFEKGYGLHLRFYAVAMERIGNMDSAMYYYNQVLEIFRRLNRERIVAQVHHNIGYCAYLKGEYDIAGKNYLLAISIRERLKDSMGLGWSQNNLGLVYWVQHRRSSALRHFKIAHKIFSDINFKDGLSTATNNIGLIFDELGKNDSARFYYQKAFEIAVEQKNENGMALGYNNLGSLEIRDKNYASAESYFSKALALNEKINNLEGITLNLRNLAQTYSNLKKYAKALDFANRSLEVAQKAGLGDGIIDAWSTLAFVYADKGDYKNAYAAHKQYALMNDSLNFGDKLAEMEARFGKEKQQQEIDMLKKENEISQMELKQKQYLLYGGAGAGLLLLLLLFFIWRGYASKKRANTALAEMNREITSQKEIIEEKSKDITDSIQYASRIQKAILPPEKDFSQFFSDHFVFYLPRDIVSGDFYWLGQVDDKTIVVVGDCTGHGVPGAFMSIMGHDLLNHIIKDNKCVYPDAILEELDAKLYLQLNKDSGSGETRDGMDVAVVTFEKDSGNCYFAGASRPIVICSANRVEVIPGSKFPVGGYLGEGKKIFTRHELSVHSGDSIYLFTDGYADQFGGPKGKKFKYKKLQELIANMCSSAMQHQKEKIQLAFSEWKGEQEQVDDILVVGLRI